MVEQEKIQKIAAVKELLKGVHMSSYCDETYCEALSECEYIDCNECSCCPINRIIKAFNRGIEFQKQQSAN